MGDAPFYRVDFAVDDSDPLQRTLNRLYGYEHDITTKVLHRSRLNLFSLLLAEQIARGVVLRLDTALDIGCSAGAYARIISDFGFRSVLGIDISDAALDDARTEFGSEAEGRRIEFRHADAENLDAVGAFDLVLCTEVIEHTVHPDRVIAGIEAALSPGGVAIVSMPNALSLPFLIGYLSYRRRRRPLDPDFRQHLRFPFYRTLRLFRDSALERVATDGTNLVLDTALLTRLYGKHAFRAVNEANFRLARVWPFRYAAQFFFVVLRRRD